jgi:hypothetical protein
MNIWETLKNLMYLVPVMLYYFFESVIIAIFVSFVWRFVLQPKIGLVIGYFDWVCLIWIVKVILFDIFKLMAGMGVTINKIEEENKS